MKWLQSHPYHVQTKVDAFQSGLNKVLSVSNMVWLACENHSILTCVWKAGSSGQQKVFIQHDFCVFALINASWTYCDRAPLFFSAFRHKHCLQIHFKVLSSGLSLGSWCNHLSWTLSLISPGNNYFHHFLSKNENNKKKTQTPG